MFTITKEWIHDNKTPKGAWTSAQLEALGFAWPAPKGWISTLEGVLITDTQKKRFEEFKIKRATNKRADAMQKLKVENELLKLENENLKGTIVRFKRLIEAIN